jgi:4-hydroxy-3-polyprenylbenzoate decarboxylase
LGRYVVAVTGASGAAYARRLVGALCTAGHDVELMVTAAGFAVLAHELDWDDPRYGTEGGVAGRCARFFRPAGAPGAVRFHPLHDVMDELASGSVRTDGMVIMPCTMGRVAAIAAGRSADLLERCADVMLKEGRPLIVVPRETPLSLVHLRNLLALAEAGAVVLPAMPGFYHRPRTVDDLVDFVVGKVLARLGLEQTLLPPWTGRS